MSFAISLTVYLLHVVSANESRQSNIWLSRAQKTLPMGRCIQKIGVKCYFLGALLESVGTLLESVGILLEYVGTFQFLPNFCLILADFLLRKKIRRQMSPPIYRSFEFSLHMMSHWRWFKSKRIFLWYFIAKKDETFIQINKILNNIAQTFKKILRN